MANSTYSPLTLESYQTNMEVWLKQLEGNTSAQLTPRIDTVGDPTVGVGIDLTVGPNLTDYLNMIGQAGNTALASLLSRAYANQQDYQSAVTAYTNAHGTIPTLSDDQAEQLYQQVEKDHYNNFVKTVGNSAYNIDTADLLNSTEGLAAFSVAYNSGSPGANLLADLNQNDFNRSDAWVQIRYLSNGGKSQSLGIAKRRYEESEVFGLYDPADTSNGTTTVPLSEAKEIYAEFSKAGDTLTGHQDYRDFIFNYEDTYGAKGIDLANGDLGSQNLLGSDVALSRVGTLQDELQPAADALNAFLNNKLANPYYSNTATFNPLDIQVALQGGGSDLVATVRSGYQLRTGTYNSALLIAQGGSDTLDDTASTPGTNNALIGDAGSDANDGGIDTFKVGDGNDYIVAGSGDALIKGSTDNGAMGSGNDTIVLGEANAPWIGGNDTVWGGSGNDVYYIGKYSQLTNIHLGKGNSTINVVGSATDISAYVLDGVGIAANPFDGAALAADSVYLDKTNQKLILSTLNPDGTKHLKIFELPPLVAHSSTQANLSKNLNLTGSTSSNTMLASAGTGTSDTSNELVIDGYTGNNLSGIQLNDSAAATIQSSNLSQLSEPSSNDYVNNGGVNNGIDSVYGSDTSGATSGNVINGEGRAKYIYAGNGDNDVFVAQEQNWATAAWSNSFDVTVQGGAGNQWLVGFGNSNDTIIGGDVGQDTTAWDTIDGGGSVGLLEGGTQNSIICGGTGQDTLVAGSGNEGGYNPQSILLAGLSFWDGNWNDTVQWSYAGGSAANYQVGLFNGSSTISLFGSDLDPAAPSSSTLPGSLLIGGTGHDDLIGNQGNDTLIGGTPLNSVAGVTDEVLVGGAGADLIYGGDGNEWIFADMPATVANWADADSSHADTIYGGPGNDEIYGSGGNDEIYGGSGNYTIYVGNGNSYVDTGSGTANVFGGSGADTIVAGGTADHISSGTGNALIKAEGAQSNVVLQGGNDTVALDAGNNVITEGSGTTTLVTGLSNGSDTVQPASQGTIVQLADGISQGDVQVSNVNGNLVVSSFNGAGQLTINGYFSNNSSNVSLQFADGTRWSGVQLQQNVTQQAQQADQQAAQQVLQQVTQQNAIMGTTGNDDLLGTLGADLIDGLGGNDYLNGGDGNNTTGSGNDVFVFNAGYGQLEIHEFYTSGQTPVLLLGYGIETSALKATISGANLILTDGIAGDQITLDYMTPDMDYLGTSHTNAYGVEAVALADGTILTRQQIYQLEMASGTTGADSLQGTTGADLLDAKGGNDTVEGNGGNDTFVFNAGYGQLNVQEADSSGQQAVLQLGTGITTSNLHVFNDGVSLILTDGISGDQITLTGQDFTNVEGVQSVVLADGTSLTPAQLLQMAMTGTTGNDTLSGTHGADFFDGKGGNDSVVGNGGNDSFVFNAGYGQLAINENYSTDQTPVLQLSSGITPSALRVSSDGVNLFLTDGVSGDQISLQNAFQSASNGVASVTFADGTSLTAAQLNQMEMVGTTGNDTFYGSQGDDLLDGKGGNDSVIGNGGSDTFVFNSGYGQLAINETFKSGQAPVLKLGAGITSSALHVAKSGNGLVLTDGVSGDQVTLINMSSSSTAGVANVLLADGTSLTRSQLIALETVGTTGNDTITGTPGAELFDGRGGNDSLIGEGGSDTFVFNSGYGKLIINEVYKSGQTPVLKLGAGITASALHATKSGSSLVLTNGVSGDQITLNGMFNNATYGVASLQLADGTTLTRAQMIALEMIGTSGNDTITGTSGDDFIDGKGGTDSVTGSGGNDTFVFNSGYGKLTINEVYTSGQTPVLKLGTGITASTLHATQSGNNMVLTDGVSGDQITLIGMWTTSTDGVATVQFSDGTTLSRSQLLTTGAAVKSAQLLRPANVTSAVAQRSLSTASANSSSTASTTASVNAEAVAITPKPSGPTTADRHTVGLAAFRERTLAHTVMADGDANSRVNSMIHAIASFTGMGSSDGGQFEKLTHTVAVPDIILHSAA